MIVAAGEQGSARDGPAGSRQLFHAVSAGFVRALHPHNDTVAIMLGMASHSRRNDSLLVNSVPWKVVALMIDQKEDEKQRSSLRD
eukprot:763153-Hanusia_phi.AAC.7